MALETQRPAAVPTGPGAVDKHLDEQAATAALYIKRHDEASQPKTGHEFLDSSHRLSSAGEFRASEPRKRYCLELADTCEQALRHPSDTQTLKISPASPLPA
jgi:hypothetical protein